MGRMKIEEEIVTAGIISISFAICSPIPNGSGMKENNGMKKAKLETKRSLLNLFLEMNEGMMKNTKGNIPSNNLMG